MPSSKLIGFRNGRLTVLRQSRKRCKATKTCGMFLCRCDCGREVEVSDSNVRKTFSCGCLTVDNNRQKSPFFGMVPAEHLTAIGRIWNNYSHPSRYRQRSRRLISFNLTQAEVLAIVSSVCAYCGSLGKPFVGIDRQDNKEGYTVSNSVPCCRRCNRAKDVLSVSVFEAWVSSIYHHRGLG